MSPSRAWTVGEEVAHAVTHGVGTPPGANGQAATTYGAAIVTVGVPLTRPVDELNDRPDGSAGEMEYDRAGPPEFEIV